MTDHKIGSREGTRTLAELFDGMGLALGLLGRQRLHLDFGVSYTHEQVREQMGPILEGEPPPVLRQMAAATGTDVAGYVSEGPGASAFALGDGAVYHTYSTYAADWSS